MADIPPEDSGAPIRVDLTGLADFAAHLRATVDGRLRPYVTEYVSALRSGSGFGHGVSSPNVGAARSHYTDCLDSMVNQVSALGTAGLVLANAAELIVARYGDADALASVSVEAVTAAVSQATQSTPDLPRVPTTGQPPVSLTRKAAF
jgi:hypothetical protein